MFLLLMVPCSEKDWETLFYILEYPSWTIVNEYLIWFNQTAHKNWELFFYFLSKKVFVNKFKQLKLLSNKWTYKTNPLQLLLVRKWLENKQWISLQGSEIIKIEKEIDTNGLPRKACQYETCLVIWEKSICHS